MKDILNLKIKRRESFRPFAPSILREAVKDWFETDDDVPFMMQVFKIREEKRKEIPAVTHVDGSGRLQTVTWARQSALCAADIGVPRSHRRADACSTPASTRTSRWSASPRKRIDCFLRTKMDVLVLGDTYIERVG